MRCSVRKRNFKTNTKFHRKMEANPLRKFAKRKTKEIYRGTARTHDKQMVGTLLENELEL